MGRFLSQRRPIRFISTIAALCCVVTGCRKKVAEAPEVSVAVQAMHATRGPISVKIEADAILAPLSEAALSPRISAPIRAEYVQRGTHVYRGQLLLTLDDGDLRGSALDSQGAVTTAQANYTATTNATIPEEMKKAQLDAAQLKTALDVAERTAAERQKLYHQGALSGRDADASVAAEAQSKAAYETAREHAEAVAKTTRLTDRETAQGQLNSAKGRLENAKAQLSFATLRSPINGVVTDRPFFPGETASAGTPVITVMDTSFLLAKLHLAQAAAQNLMLREEADVHLPGVSHPLSATVAFISPALDAGSTTVEVWLKLPNAEGHLKVGTPVHAVILGTTILDALQLPVAAILPGQENATAVMVVDYDGAAHKRPVTVGVRTPETVQIFSGLTTSDNVITEGSYGLDEGTKVTIGRPGNDNDARKEGKGKN